MKPIKPIINDLLLRLSVFKIARHYGEDPSSFRNDFVLSRAKGLARSAGSCHRTHTEILEIVFLPLTSRLRSPYFFF